jgi:deferrochelatase/peroxidase EfeB
MAEDAKRPQPSEPERAGEEPASGRDEPPQPEKAAIRRRTFLAAGAALGAGAAVDRLLGPAQGRAAQASADPADDIRAAVPFEGLHQAGVLTERPAQAIFAAFDAIVPSRAEAAEALRALSERARALTRGYTPLVGAPTEGPTPDSGILGARVEPDRLTVTIGLGSSLFDRYDLTARRPRKLTPMTTFPDDALVAAETHGDLLVQLCAGTGETLLHALRDLMRATRGALAPRWKVEGFLPAPRESGASRNLLGFKDGTANPDTTDAALMDRLVWVGSGGGEPGWAVGGTYQVVRIIRNRVEFWDRVSRSEQELMIGRDKVSGAPLDGRREADAPRYGDDPHGRAIPLDAHIRLARPRTRATEASRILRRPYNYSRGIDDAGQLDMGLIFCCFQRDVQRQFEAVQKRLAGEPLVDYVVPTGGGYFFVPPGARDSQDWVGSGLFT